MATTILKNLYEVSPSPWLLRCAYLYCSPILVGQTDQGLFLATQRMLRRVIARLWITNASLFSQLGRCKHVVPCTKSSRNQDKPASYNGVCTLCIYRLSTTQ